MHRCTLQLFSFTEPFVGTHLQLWLKLPDLFFEQSKCAFRKVQGNWSRGFLIKRLDLQCLASLHFLPVRKNQVLSKHA